jgi:hypothetical protein
MTLKPIKFISEPVEPIFDKPPLYEKKPPCPDGFTWRDQEYRILRNLREWKDFSRRGRMAHNMRQTSQRKAARRGSIGVGKFHFRVQVENGRLFDLYYDRAVLSADDRKGSWILHQELGEESTNPYHPT